MPKFIKESGFKTPALTSGLKNLMLLKTNDEVFILTVTFERLKYCLQH